ncbi:MAG: hypothetical protein D3926_10870 [Desulfobacteraceae bacterium]|nr:MAG: hypothetical protein D3926_10870 [Desulfobacteraceae bacterium]
MDPDKFRESRIEINGLLDHIFVAIEKKAYDDSKSTYEKACSLLEDLSPQAEGEIQERSVKNLAMKVEGLLSRIEKIKPKKKQNTGAGYAAASSIEWDESRVAHLSINYLQKVFTNMGDDGDKVFFSTSGKGIRPSYQIEFKNHDLAAFNGAAHSPLKKTFPPESDLISQPFTQGFIRSVIEQQMKK